jgi:hypothetical protein
MSLSPEETHIMYCAFRSLTLTSCTSQIIEKIIHVPLTGGNTHHISRFQSLISRIKHIKQIKPTWSAPDANHSKKEKEKERISKDLATDIMSSCTSQQTHISPDRVFQNPSACRIATTSK